MKVVDVMSETVVFCRPDDRDDHAARLMWDHDCGALPVVDKDERVVGMVTDRDVCMAAYSTGRALRELVVADAMSKEAIGCAPSETLEHALERMARHRVRRLPVLDADGCAVGMLSLNDVVRAAAAPGAEPLGSATLEALRSVGEPRRAVDRARAPRTAASGAETSAPRSETSPPHAGAAGGRRKGRAKRPAETERGAVRS